MIFRNFLFIPYLFFDILIVPKVTESFFLQSKLSNKPIITRIKTNVCLMSSPTASVNDVCIDDTPSTLLVNQPSNSTIHIRDTEEYIDKDIAKFMEQKKTKEKEKNTLTVRYQKNASHEVV